LIAALTFYTSLNLTLTEANVGDKRIFLEIVCDDDDLLEENKNKYSKGQAEHT
jgi:hypothetical protein